MNNCPVCKNKIGFAFGTCCECGYNYLEGKYKNITVCVSDLEIILGRYSQDLYDLIEKHDSLKRRH